VLKSEDIEAWSAAHHGAAVAVDRLGAALGATFRRWYVGHLVVALAGRSPSLTGGRRPQLLPAPRAFFSDYDHNRLAGTAAAFDHVDVRIALVRDGFEPVLVRPETPFVLHALAESGATGSEVTNPGLMRTKVASWLATVSPYVHPPAEMARPIIEELVATMAASQEPAPAVAAWAAFTWMSVHPWVDGNGRTARLLYLLLTGSHLELDLDYGVVEQFTFQRRAYVEALQAGQHVTPVYDPDVLDPVPFTRAATAWSIEGAALLMVRARVLELAAQRLGASRPDLADGQVALALWVGLERVASADAFASGRSSSTTMTAPIDDLEELCGLGVAARRPLPPSRRTRRWAGIGGGPVGYFAVPEVNRSLGEAVDIVEAEAASART